MANQDRRGGIGFGNQRGADNGPRHEDEEAPVEATRAMDIDDFAPSPTEFVKSPGPVPPPQRGAPPPPGRPPQRPPSSVLPSSVLPSSAPPSARPAVRQPQPPPPVEEEMATRMLNAVDYDPADPMAGFQAAPPPPDLLPVELRMVAGPDRGKIHRLDEGIYLVGRGLDCTIVLGDPAVSRKHFKIERTGDEVVVHDLGGANGTSINGTKKPRHVLEPGDQIEVGTSCMEFHVEGITPKRKDARGGGADKPMVEQRGMAQAKSAKKGGPGMVIAIAAAGFLVLVGGGVAAWLIIGKGDDKPAEGETAEGAPAEGGAAAAGSDNPEVQKLVEEAKGMLSDADFATALDKLKEARKLDKENQEIKDLIKNAQKEIEAQEILEEGKASMKTGDFAGAIKKFAEIEKSSLQHAEAQDELAAAKEAFFAAKMTEAKKAADAADGAGAKAAIDAILAVDKDHAEAKALKDQLAGGAAADPEGKAVVPTDPKVAAADPKVAAAAADPKAVAPAAAGSKKADFASGFNAYHSRSWSAAIQAFDGIANGPYPKPDKAKGAAMAGAVKAVEEELNKAGAAGANARAAANAYKAAYNADKRVDSHHGGFLAGKIADAYLAQARTAFGAKNYADAADAVRESMNYNPDKPESLALEAKCVQQASVMLKDAKGHMEKKNFAVARDLARQVVRIVPSMDPRYGEAQDIAKKATEAFQQDDD